MDWPVMLKSKTFWTALIALVAAGAGMATGELTLVAGLQSMFAALLVIFLRQGMIVVTPPVAPDNTVPGK